MIETVQPHGGILLVQLHQPPLDCLVLSASLARLALQCALMHCAEVMGDPTETSISAETMYAATCIAEYLGAHAAAAYQVMGADTDCEDAKYILKRLSGRESITHTELTRLCQGRFAKSDDMDPSLAVLEDRGYIRTGENPVGYNNRRQVIYNIKATPHNPSKRRRVRQRCQWRIKIVRKRRTNFAVFRRGCGNEIKRLLAQKESSQSAVYGA